MSQKAWMQAYTKGSKSLQARLSKIHAKNPEFQEFVKKHGFGSTLSPKQSEKQKTHSTTSVKPVTDPHPEMKMGPQDRLAMIKASAEKHMNRRREAANRVAFGGELGGGFQMPHSSFRRYSEDTVVEGFKAGDKVRLKKDWAHGDPDTVYKIHHTNDDGQHWIGDKDKRGWYAGDHQLRPARTWKKTHEMEEEKVTIHSPEHKDVHGKKGDVFHKFDDGRVNVQVKMGSRRGKGVVRNYTLHPGQFKKLDESWTTEKKPEPKYFKELGMSQYHVVKHKDKVVGDIHKDENGWNALHHKSDLSWDSIDSKEEAAELVRDHHSEYMANKPKPAKKKLSHVEKLKVSLAVKEDVPYMDGHIATTRGGWVAKRGGKQIGTVVSTKDMAKAFINSTRKTLRSKVSKIVRQKAKDIAHGFGRFSVVPASGVTSASGAVAESVGKNPEDMSSLTVDTPRNKAQVLRAAGKHLQAREIERKAFAIGAAREKKLATESKANRERVASWDSAIVVSKKRLPKMTVDPKSKINKLRQLARMGLNRVLSTENMEMSRKEKLDELKKSTLASYVGKAAENLPTKQGLATSFTANMDKNERKARVLAKKHAKNPDAKTFAKWADEKDRSAGNAYWAVKFGTAAKNRLKGIKTAAAKLAKEEIATDVQMDDRTGKLKAVKTAPNLPAAKKQADRFAKKLRKESSLPRTGEDELEWQNFPPQKTTYKISAKVSKTLAKYHKKAAKGSQYPELFKNVGKVYAKNEEVEEINEKNTDSHPKLWNTHALVHDSGKVLEKGATVKGFRGSYKIQGFEMPHHEGSTGRVYTDKGTFFPGVVNAKIVKRDVAMKEDVEQVDEVSRSTVASVATKRFAQAQKALKDKDFNTYVSKMKKAIKAADSTTPNTGWSVEEDKKIEEVIVVETPEEKYMKIRKGKASKACGCKGK